MNLELEIYGSRCSTSVFEINGLEAESSDFGISYDADPENAEDYGCGDRVFEGVGPTSEVLEKYKISEEEYYSVVGELEKGLSFGSCGWCI